jgi:hypothetical protein
MFYFFVLFLVTAQDDGEVGNGDNIVDKSNECGANVVPLK